MKLSSYVLFQNLTERYTSLFIIYFAQNARNACGVLRFVFIIPLTLNVQWAKPSHLSFKSMPGLFSHYTFLFDVR